MSIRDFSAAMAGLAATAWNFVASGHLNTILAAVVGALTIVVLLQRYRINRQQLDRGKRRDRASDSS